jgi:cytochrome c-type biogenesis protein CcmH/NrfF
MPAYEMSTQTAHLQIVVNPLVNWIWFGFGLLALGTGIALLPERAYSFALTKMPADAAATATGLFLVMCVAGGTTLSAQMSGGAETQSSFFARTPFEKQMQHEIVCTCGCGHITIAECRKDPCGTSHKMRGELAALIDEGKSRDEIIQAFVTRYDSQEMLGAPIDRGFSRLAWLFPYLVGAGGAMVIGFAAVRWSRRSPAASDAPTTNDPDLEMRLNDELRDLD